MNTVNTDQVTIDGHDTRGLLTIQHETVQIPPSMLPEPDPDWHHVDKAGHEHRYDDGYPTLEDVVVGTWWCLDCHEHHERTELRCRVCGEAIQPGTRPPSPFPTYIPGRSSWTVEVTVPAGLHLEQRQRVQVVSDLGTGEAEVVGFRYSAGEPPQATLVGATSLDRAEE